MAIDGRDAHDLLRDLIALDTVAAGEGAAAALTAGLLDDAGLSTRTVGWEPGREQVVAVTPEPAETPPLTFTGHLDTVPADARDWRTDPWLAELDGDHLVGRGASDMKSGVAAFLAALRDHRSRPHRCRGVQVVLTAGEETGCDGAARIPADLLRPGGWLLVGEPTANRVVPAHKGALWLRLAARGVSAHGSAPELGRNAVVALARAAVALHDAADWPEAEGFGAVTANVGLLNGGTQPNVVPDAAELLLDLRTVPGSGPEELRSRVRAIVGPDVEIADLVDLPMVSTPLDSPLVAAVRAVLRDAGLADEPSAPARFFTDASVLAGALDAAGTVVLGPGEPGQCHVVDEWCSLTRLEQAVDVYGRLLDSWCSPGSDLLDMG
ncbi:succinyl-diaminopimelate desuccinylase [Spinactinospora alkalitolerans]|uniref:Succinyl-diaminopimelate desuccinylase n=1 Tax=Spinactinospora alkalitolerans TaxID=687207 RepID=A0A852TQ18_9ACTN|nr:M20/M25/M40 family metallo-hydrolase [Spinactinospora alkalitolerans]NYE46058.1 succinyl-diaminopimelate desuccinylase [Spinactinospora alkalitolerans]